MCEALLGSSALADSVLAADVDIVCSAYKYSGAGGECVVSGRWSSDSTVRCPQ